MCIRDRTSVASGNEGLKWRVVRELLHADECKSYSSNEASTLCDSFSLFLIDKLNRISDTVCKRLISTPPLLHPPVTRICPSTLSALETVTIDEVARVIRLLPQKTSPLDIMPVSLLKLSADIMAPLIARLANLSFTNGVFPSGYKAGQVTLLLKKPSLPAHDPANYRPISNLCMFSKILEKLFLLRLRPHIMNSGRYCKFQSAYRKGHSTETALLKVINDVQRAAGQGLCTVLLAINISTAFDTVHHDTLLDRARTVFSNEEVALYWIRSFVTGRTQQIVVESEKSTVFASSSGVPQGSVLGPMLFGMYISPVGDVITQHRVCYHQYTDDMQLYVSLWP